MFSDGAAALDKIAHERLGAVLDTMARDPLPAAGAALAIGLSMAAALLEKAAAAPRGGVPVDAAAEARAGRLRRDALRLAGEDAAAYRRVVAARSAGGDAARMRVALLQAAEPPLAMAQIGTKLARIAESILDDVAPNMQGEVRAAAHLACAATIAAADLVRIDVADDEHERSQHAARLAGEAALAAQALAGRPLRA